jgi:hypothetical protein
MAMTAALPFTAASIARIVRGIERAGRFVIGVKPDGTMIIGDKPVETSSLVPVEPQSSPLPERRFGEKINGDQGAA